MSLKPGGLDREGTVPGPGIPEAAITQPACLLWTVARGKGTGYTESKIEIRVMASLPSSFCHLRRVMLMT